MKQLTRLVSGAIGTLLFASTAFAADPTNYTNATSVDIVGNLGFFSTLAATIMAYSKYIAFFIAVISLLALWSTGMLAKVSRKVEQHINAQDSLKKWLIEGVLVIIAFIILFNFVIPTINTYVPST